VRERQGKCFGDGKMHSTKPVSGRQRSVCGAGKERKEAKECGSAGWPMVGRRWQEDGSREAGSGVRSCLPRGTPQ
jgi:hypothetical protein